MEQTISEQSLKNLELSKHPITLTCVQYTLTPRQIFDQFLILLHYWLNECQPVITSPSEDIGSLQRSQHN
jgi:hypothetical protein